ncbi:hypothetical protein ZWY2020_009665 [Hordeum vulgare]|nr:hypothetical protein ZWY2020_009665 [Hordeum vulgare]
MRIHRSAAVEVLRATVVGLRPYTVASPPSAATTSTSSSNQPMSHEPLKKDASQVKRSKVEIIKEKSNFLRYPLNEELVSEAPNVNETVVQLIKFHGSYREAAEKSVAKNYSFMLGTKNPSEKFNQLYLAMDTLADEFGIGTLRRQPGKHFSCSVLKKNLKHVIDLVIKNMGSTLVACGDLNRIKDILFAQEIAENIVALLAPQSGAYYYLWVDGEKIMSAEEPPEVTKARNDNSHGTNFPDSPEPIYGTQYLPKMFMIAVTVAGDNSVDILTNDIGVVLVSDMHGSLLALTSINAYLFLFIQFVQVGGGMGRTHRIETTFPRLADPLGYVPKEDISYVIKAIVVTQRENRRRDDRRYSTLKYLLDSSGIDNASWGQAKKTSEIIEMYNLDVSITPNQNLILCGVDQAWREPITVALAQAGLLEPKDVDLLNITSMSCLALPLCPLAQTKVERGILPILKRIRAVFDKRVCSGEDNGCPNGSPDHTCMVEVGFVGSPSRTPNQTTLGETFMNKVKLQDIEKVLEPQFSYRNSMREEGKSFGSFTNRMPTPTVLFG